MRSLVFTFTALAASSQATLLLDRNLAYRSPFIDHPEVRQDMTLSCQCYESPAQHGLDTKSIHARHVQQSKRQIIDATPFKDEHYPNFYGSDFSNVLAADSCFARGTRHVPGLYLMIYIYNIKGFSVGDTVIELWT